MELGDVLRDRRKAAGRTIASVAVDAGLSVPYIANLENGRGNPTLAALDRLATALGARLEIRIDDEAPAPPPSAAADLVATSDRANEVLATLNRPHATARRDLITTLDTLQSLLGHPPTPADLNRLLDLVQLAD
ncbi:helix-turn-helix domain-containing protein [Kribbella sp. NPDC059898]|uniref:helix-turn-helix domain-containing protein n=1 Tax=Kribbella sp. NPDC059898 TaxID=3346995 RepID=UPI00365A410F